MTQSEFIEKVNQVAGISFRNATLSSWENGQSSPTSDLLPVIAQILETSVTYLFTPGEGNDLANPTDTSNTEEPGLFDAAKAKTELYRKLFEDNPKEAFTNLLQEYEALVNVNERLKEEKQKLEGKLSASSDFLTQLINMKGN
ncbi:hypothetical protein JMN32_07750 [Fulvivirga sp. 29W222]|uniref:HTH cro/C1-type domain-containing protein n=2 Tax=Fulvivirga marina TaxID=2494733 RepID=A0A937FWC4_9BACT|nr:hypothetical protein [Fulvivirga marina]